MRNLFSRAQESDSFERFVGDISMRLLRTDPAAPAASMQAILADIGERYGMDRVHLRWAPEETGYEDGQFTLAAGWQRSGEGPGKVFTAKEVPWCLAQLRKAKTIYFDKLDELPAEAASDRLALESRGIQAALILGLTVDENILGAFSLSTLKPFRWSEAVRQEVSSLAAILTNYYWSINNRVRLKESEARYRGVVQDLSDMIVRCTPDGKTTWANERWCEYLGKSQEELIGSTELVFMSEDDWREFKKMLSRLTPANPAFSYDYKWVKPTGEVAWSEWTERGIFDKDGKLTEVQSVGRDITERKRADAALQRRAAFQTRLAEISSRLLGVSAAETNEVIADIQERIGVEYGLDRVNVAWYASALPGFGKPMTWSRDGAAVKISKPEGYPYAYRLIQQGEVLRFDRLDDLPDEAEVDRANYAKDGVASLLVVPLRIDQTIFGAAGFIRCQQRDWDDSTVNELQLIAHAITNAVVRQWSTAQISRRERDLARSQQVARVGSYRLRATFNNDDSPDILNILSLNMTEQALEIFGIEAQPDPRAQVMSLLAKIHPDDEPFVREIWQKTLAAGTEHSIEYRIVNDDGSITHVQAREQFDGIDSDDVITIFGTYLDVTEWVKANQKLQTALSEIEELKDRLQEENVILRDEVLAAHGFDKIVGNSRKLREILTSVRQVAPTDVTVLICGETGTGKELVARSIHDLSNRKDKSMVSVNCAALSAELIESELFGHEKGSFTGAHSRRKGRFEIADGGTLFLDEIGEMSGDLQAKLLRVIQEGEFERLGGSRTLKTDVRLIAATNRDLQKAMDRGEFRADLYYRINAFPIELPPLRERKSDIPLLAEHLVRKHAANLGKEVKSVSQRTLRYLQEQDWPGNIRELEGTLVRALISVNGPVLDYVGETTRTNVDDREMEALSLLEAQRKHIIEVLKQTGWVIEGKKGAASVLGLAPSSLRSKMQRLNIVRPSPALTS